MLFDVRARSRRRCAKLGASVPRDLPRVEFQSVRPAEDIAFRSVILYVMVGLAEPAVDPIRLVNWLKCECLFAKSTIRERGLIESAGRGCLSEQDVVNLSWLREAWVVLLWSCSVTDWPGPPSETASLSHLFAITPPEVEIADFVARARLRDTREFHQQLDFYYCLHHALRSGQQIDVSMSVVTERRRALEWVLSDEEWDDVSLDT